MKIAFIVRGRATLEARLKKIGLVPQDENFWKYPELAQVEVQKLGFSPKECKQVAAILGEWKHRRGSGTYWWRVQIPAEWLAKRGHEVAYVDTITKPSKEHPDLPDTFNEYDVVVFQRLSQQDIAAALTKDKAWLDGKKACIVYETDDLLHGVPLSNPTADTYSEGVLNAIDLFLQQSHVLTVTCPGLRDYYAQRTGKSVFVCPNSIDYERWARPAAKNDTGKVRILWAGSKTHDADFRVFEIALRKLIHTHRNKFRLVLFGSTPSPIAMLAKAHADVIRSVDVEDYPQRLSELAPDVCIAPLSLRADEVNFNVCKSNIKRIEAGALGVPAVTTDIATYNLDAPEGAVYCKTADDWHAALAKMIDEPDYRRAMGAVNAAFTRRNYNIAETIGRWEVAFEEGIKEARKAKP